MTQKFLVQRPSLGDFGGLCCLGQLLALGRGSARVPQCSAPLSVCRPVRERFLEGEQETCWRAGRGQQILLPELL